jgi:hypothetical protein
VKGILWHLVDWVSNNYQWSVCYIPTGNLNFPAYDQEQNVKMATNYQAFDYDHPLALWYSYNKMMMHMFAGIPTGDMDSTTTVGTKPSVSLRQSIPNYFDYLENHEHQARRITSG